MNRMHRKDQQSRRLQIYLRSRQTLYLDNRYKYIAVCRYFNCVEVSQTRAAVYSRMLINHLTLLGSSAILLQQQILLLREPWVMSHQYSQMKFPPWIYYLDCCNRYINWRKLCRHYRFRHIGITETIPRLYPAFPITSS